MGNLFSGHHRQEREGRFWKEGVGEHPCPKPLLFLASTPYLQVLGLAVCASVLVNPPSPTGIHADTSSTYTAWLRTPASGPGRMVCVCVHVGAKPLHKHVCEHGLQPALMRPAGFLSAAELAALTGL